MYIIYVTKTTAKRYIIKDANDYKPCSCVYEKVSEHEDILEAVKEKQRLEAEVQ